MQNLDPQDLFSIFEQGDEEIYKEHNVTEVLKNPYVLMGMVLRGIDNFRLMDLMYQRNFPEEYKKVAPRIKLKYYDNLYGYLTRIKWDSTEDVFKVGNSYDLAETHNGLSVLLSYYEFIEHYEKCAVIKKCLDRLYDAQAELIDDSFID